MEVAGCRLDLDLKTGTTGAEQGRPAPEVSTKQPLPKKKPSYHHHHHHHYTITTFTLYDKGNFEFSWCLFMWILLSASVSYRVLRPPLFRLSLGFSSFIFIFCSSNFPDRNVSLFESIFHRSLCRYLICTYITLDMCIWKNVSEKATLLAVSPLFARSLTVVSCVY